MRRNKPNPQNTNPLSLFERFSIAIGMVIFGVQGFPDGVRPTQPQQRACRPLPQKGIAQNFQDAQLSTQ